MTEDNVQLVSEDGPHRVGHVGRLETGGGDLVEKR